MLVKDLRKIIAGLDDDTKLEIKDVRTGETYDIHEIEVRAYKKPYGPECVLTLKTNIADQTASYVIS